MKTIGEFRVRTDFNPSDIDTVSLIKSKTAELINLMELQRPNHIQFVNPGQEEEERIFGEKMRLLSLAQTAYEEAAMWAVKAVTVK